MTKSETKTAKQSGAATAALFLGLEEHELRALSAHAAIQTFPKHAIIVNEGDQSDSIFIINSGRVKVYLHNDEGKEVVLNVHGPGEYFGEMVLD